MKKLFGLLILVLATSGFSFDGQVYSLLNNASFEDDNPRASASPAGWTSKTPGSTPDILPGAWGLNIPAHHGKTCIGLVTRDDGSVEDVGQCLEKQLTKGDCFSFSIYLSHAPQYVGYNQACRLRIWGGNAPGSKQELLASSPLVNHKEWKAYPFRFSPSANYSCITFEVYYAPGTTIRYKGNILLDECSAIEKCVKA